MFLCKIGRKDFPMCAFCHNAPETIIHIFCDCEKVQPIWNGLISLNNDKFDPDCNLNNFDRLFGIENEPLLSYLILCCKFYIYKCRFQNSTLHFTAFKFFLVLKRKIKDGTAYKDVRLSKHFKKWCFDLLRATLFFWWSFLIAMIVIIVSKLTVL